MSNKLKQKINNEVKKIFYAKLAPAIEPKKRLLTDIVQQRAKIGRDIESFKHKLTLVEEQVDKLQAEVDEALLSGKEIDLQKIGIRRAELDTFQRQLTRLDAQDREQAERAEKITGGGWGNNKRRPCCHTRRDFRQG